MSDGSAQVDPAEAAKVSNARGGSPYIVVCDHASNFMPARFERLGLQAADLHRHIAWDPGALPVAQRLAELLDAPLVESCLSRLLIDCNRPLGAPDLIPAVSETTEVPGNRNLSGAAVAERVALAYEPFHAAISALVDERLAQGAEARLVSIHSFTPVYKGTPRPWHIGVIHDGDERLSAALLEQLRREPGIVVGDNEPYSPADRVYFTLERHARSHGMPCVMVELRNDQIADAAGQRVWAAKLAGILAGMHPEAIQLPQASSAGRRRVRQ